MLFFRQDRDQWRAVWPLGLHLGADWPMTYALTVEGGVESWAAVARDLGSGHTSPTPTSFSAQRAAPG